MANDPVPNPDPQNVPTADPPASDPPAVPADLDAYLATLPEEQRTLVDKLRTDWHDGQVTGLKSALTKEREAASEATKELRKLAKEADEKTAAALNKLADDKDAVNESLRRESAFYHDAAIAGIQPGMIDRAWLLCRNADYFTKRGDPDIAAMKAEIPELFAAPQTTTQTNAGTGTRQQPAVKEDFNTNLRGALKPQ
jgi:hypothetical protein